MTNDEIKALALRLAREACLIHEGHEGNSQLFRFARLCIAQGLEMGEERCEELADEADDRAEEYGMRLCETRLRDMAAEMLK